MCDIVEEYARERAEEAAKEAAKEAVEERKACARELFKNGASIELVEKSIKGLSTEEIHKIYEVVMQKTEQK